MTANISVCSCTLSIQDHLHYLDIDVQIHALLYSVHMKVNYDLGSEFVVR